MLLQVVRRILLLGRIQDSLHVLQVLHKMKTWERCTTNTPFKRSIFSGNVILLTIFFAWSQSLTTRQWYSCVILLPSGFEHKYELCVTDDVNHLHLTVYYSSLMMNVQDLHFVGTNPKIDRDMNVSRSTNSRVLRWSFEAGSKEGKWSCSNYDFNSIAVCGSEGYCESASIQTPSPQSIFSTSTEQRQAAVSVKILIRCVLYCSGGVRCTTCVSLVTGCGIPGTLVTPRISQ